MFYDLCILVYTHFFLQLIRRPPRSTLFPTRRSSDLSRYLTADLVAASAFRQQAAQTVKHVERRAWCELVRVDVAQLGRSEEHRLNSSHSQISYAVFCLKKKNNKTSSAVAQIRSIVYV